MGSCFVSKCIVPLLGVVWLGAGCGDIARDNPLDPKNTDSQTAQKVLIEAFVNTGNTLDYNQIMLTALNTLQQRHPQRLALAVYHRNTADHMDSLHINEAELQYQRYLNAVGSSLKGVPDVFINGDRQRVQGASSVPSALFRLEEALAAEFSQTSSYMIEVAVTQSQQRLSPEVTVARLGNSTGRDLRIKALLTVDCGGPYGEAAVTAVTRSAEIASLAHGEQTTVSLPALPVDAGRAMRLVVLVTSRDESTVYQCSVTPL